MLDEKIHCISKCKIQNSKYLIQKGNIIHRTKTVNDVSHTTPMINTYFGLIYYVNSIFRKECQLSLNVHMNVPIELVEPCLTLLYNLLGVNSITLRPLQ